MKTLTFSLPVLALTALLAGCGSTVSTPAAPTPTPTPTPAPAPSLPLPTSFTTLDGPMGSPTTFNGLSNSGLVAGLTVNGGVNSNFLRSADGDITPLDLGDPAAGMVNGVNASGTAVGVSNGQAFVLMGGKLTALSPFGSTASVAFGINDNGVIVGQYTAGSKMPGFVDAGGTFTNVIPTPAALVTNVQGVNNAGLATGFYSEDGTHQHGFLFDTTSQKVTLLPDPTTARTQAGGLVLTQFLGLNDRGEAVGYYQTNNGSQFGFLFDLSKQAYTFLDDPQAAPVKGVQITQITGVNNAGEITGFYIDAQGVQHGFVATP